MDDTERDGDRRPSERGRGVTVPMEVYKVVIVFSMLFAVALVVGGFAVIDSATDRGTADVDEVNVPLALVGLVTVGCGAAVYVFSTRFRTEQMENAKDDTDKPSDNG